MAVFSDKISLSTKGFCDVHDITPRLREILSESGLREGVLSVILAGSTGGITTIEYEPGLLKDLENVLEKITPSSQRYEHDAAWGDGNGFSHLRSALIGASASIPFSNGKLILGTWQQVVFLDFDNRPRERTLHVQLVGEK
ncbi:hypothetical protein ES703_17865 [subsurface metagenome]|nr:YjbQ family protein [bacterium]